MRPTLAGMGVGVPTVSLFYGIAVRIYFRDHQPPHFHARYGGAEALIRIADGTVLRGQLPARARRLVEEWRNLHLDELHDRWNNAQAGTAVHPIRPLE